MDNWFQFECPKGVYAAFAEVQSPPGFKEVSRIFDETGLVKVFFEKVDDDVPS